MLKSKIAMLVISSLACLTTANAAKFGEQIDETTETLRQAVIEEPQQVSEKTAEEMADDFLNDAVEKGVLEQPSGWSNEQEILVAVGSASYAADISSPDFLKIRSMKAIEAGLNAKAEMIRFIRTDLSVENVITTPETGLSTEYDTKLQSLQNKLKLKAQNYEKALKEAKALEAQGDFSVEALLEHGILAGLKQQGINVDLNQIRGEQREKLKKAQEELLALQTEIDQMKAEAEQLRGQLKQENTSQMMTMSAMPLVGAMTIGQWESFVNNEYQISVVMTWSPKQERFIRAMNEGKPIEQTFHGSMSMNDFIKNNDWSTAIGGRKFMDDKGNFSIIGVGAWPIVGDGSAARRSAEGQARLMAQSSIALAIKGDIASYEMAQAKVQELQSGNLGKVETQVKDSFASELSEKVKNLQLQGLSRLYGRKMQHPISGQDMYVTVYGYSVKGGEVARAMEKSNFDAAAAIEKQNNYSKGMKAGLDASYERTRNDPKAFKEGLAEGQNASNEDKASSVKQTQGTAPNSHTGGQRQVTGAGTSSEGFLY